MRTLNSTNRCKGSCWHLDERVSGTGLSHRQDGPSPRLGSLVLNSLPPSHSRKKQSEHTPDLLSDYLFSFPMNPPPPNVS